MLYIYLAMLESPDDKEKMSELYLTYRDYLLNVAKEILHNEADAEDVVHQAFLRVANNFAKIGVVSSHQTRNYLVIIVKGLALNLYRKRSKLIEVPFEDVDGTEDSLAVEDQNFDLFEYEDLYQAIEQLPFEQRSILYLMYYEELSVREISKALELSAGAVKKRLQRARLAVQKILAMEGVEAK